MGRTIFERHARLLAASGLVASLCACPESYDDEPEPRCGKYAVVDGELVREFAAVGESEEPGELGGVRIEVSIPPETGRALKALVMNLEVHTGQALPGERLELTRSGQRLAEGELGGAHGNRQDLSVRLELPECAEGCGLRFLVSGPPVAASVPVPIEVKARLEFELDESTSSCPTAPEVGAFDDRETGFL